MGLFSLITLKKDIQNVFSKENIQNLKDYATTKIEAYVKEQMDGPLKKVAVDALVISYIKEHFITKNTYVNILVQLLIGFTPQLTQIIYDDLKKFVKDLTDKI